MKPNSTKIKIDTDCEFVILIAEGMLMGGMSVNQLLQNPSLRNLGVFTCIDYYHLIGFNWDGVKLLQKALDFRTFITLNIACKNGKLHILTIGSLTPHPQDISYGFPHVAREVNTVLRRSKTSEHMRKHDAYTCKNLTHDSIVCDGKPLIFPTFKRLKYYSTADNFCYRFRLRLPIDNTTPKPLIVFLDGAGHPGYDNIKQLFGALQSQRRLKKEHVDCYFLAPQLGTLECYNTDIHSDRLWQIINTINADYGNVDLSRIYLIGISYGGYGAIYEAFRHPDRYAAAVPTVGWIYLDGQSPLNMLSYGSDKYHLPFTDDGLRELAQVPMWLACSHIELEHNQALYDMLKPLNASVKFTRNDKGGHAMHIGFFRRQPWVEWMFNQKLQPSAITNTANNEVIL